MPATRPGGESPPETRCSPQLLPEGYHWRMDLPSPPDRETSWTMIEAARAGDEAARRGFTERYLPVVRAYVAARWRGSPFLQEMDDCIQDVFLKCFAEGGALERLEKGKGSGFRAFLFGVTKNAALHVETRRAREYARRGENPPTTADLEAREASLSRVFDREWARALLRRAVEAQSRTAATRGAEHLRRVELLRLRFQEGRPIREIARVWEVDPAQLHHEYAQARREFLAALRGVVAPEERCTEDELKRECQRLLELLQED